MWHIQNRFTLRNSYVLKPKSKGCATLTTAKPSNLKDTLNVTNEELYPSISTVLLILYTMPASTATTERSFSALRRLKTYLRTTMMQDRLTSLAVLHVHKDIDIDIDMRSFTLGKSRHIDFDYGHVISSSTRLKWEKAMTVIKLVLSWLKICIFKRLQG